MNKSCFQRPNLRNLIAKLHTPIALPGPSWPSPLPAPLPQAYPETPSTQQVRKLVKVSSTPPAKNWPSEEQVAAYQDHFFEFILCMSRAIFEETHVGVSFSRVPLVFWFSGKRYFCFGGGGGFGAGVPHWVKTKRDNPQFCGVQHHVLLGWTYALPKSHCCCPVVPAKSTTAETRCVRRVFVFRGVWVEPT